MIEYCVLGAHAHIKCRSRITPRGGHVTLGVPEGATVYVNGHPLVAPNGRAKIPLTCLSERNTVRIQYDKGLAVGESFLWDGTSLMPAGYDADTALRECVALLFDARSRIAALEATLAHLQGEVEKPLFI